MVKLLVGVAGGGYLRPRRGLVVPGACAVLVLLCRPVQSVTTLRPLLWRARAAGGPRVFMESTSSLAACCLATGRCGRWQPDLALRGEGTANWSEVRVGP